MGSEMCIRDSHRARREPGARGRLRQSGARQGARGADAGVGHQGGRGRLGWLDPDRRRLQERARHGHAAGRLRPRRRPRAFAERKVRPHLVPQGHALLGAHHRGAGGLTPSAFRARRRAPRVTEQEETPMPQMSGGDAVVQALSQHGITSIYCLPGIQSCLLYTSPSPRDGLLSRMPSSA